MNDPRDDGTQARRISGSIEKLVQKVDFSLQRKSCKPKNVILHGKALQIHSKSLNKSVFPIISENGMKSLILLTAKVWFK